MQFESFPIDSSCIFQSRAYGKEKDYTQAIDKELKMETKISNNQVEKMTFDADMGLGLPGSQQPAVKDEADDDAAKCKAMVVEIRSACKQLQKSRG